MAAARRVDEVVVASPTGIPLLEVPGWRDRFGVVAGITGRGEEFTLGLTTNHPAATVTDNWRRFRGHHRLFPRVVLGLQVHGTDLQIHGVTDGGWAIYDGIDGHITTHPGTLLTVTVADCVPVYVLHPATGTVCLLHVGWRGCAAGILEEGLRAITASAGCGGSDLVMHVGVSICGACYEVGPKVASAVTGSPADGPVHLDLRGELAGRARAFGVPAISASGWCTAHDEDRFFSHRRSRGADGRMVAYLGRPEGSA